MLSRSQLAAVRPHASAVTEFQEDPNVYEESFTFLFGRDILVANILEPGAVAAKSICLPVHAGLTGMFHALL